MTSYLEEQIQCIFDRHKDEMDEISVIIPNRRASVYIQKYFAKYYKQPFFPPEILTIADWIRNHTDKRILDSTELLFVLHSIHQVIEGEHAEDFEKFMLWGKTMLSDFDEIDKYLIEPGKVFKNLKDIKELESWDLEEAELGEAQKKFQQIWDKLSEYHAKLQVELVKMDATYKGRAERIFLEHIKDHIDKKHYYFIGFNALSKAETEIIKHLLTEKKATALFDIDQSYFENPIHEASRFYKQAQEELNIPKQIGKAFDQHPKQIEIIETSQQIGQAKIAGALTRELLNKGEKAEDIAIVLADESLLIPLTRSLPAEIETANITMGWPIKFSHLRGFLDIVFDIQFDFQKFRDQGLYHKTLLNFLQHPYTIDLLNSPNIKRDVQKRITDTNRIFMSLEELVEIDAGFEDFNMILFQWQEDNQDRLKVFHQLIQKFYGCFSEQEDKQIDLEIIFQFKNGLEKFQEIVQQYDVALSTRAFRTLFYQFWQAESLSFLGNPIDGLQVMGILESRSLDFKNLILIGMNEGALPKSSYGISFIPRDLRLYLGLPTEEDRQAVFAHHFYRLLHRSSNVYMTYNSNAEGLGSGERSRYVIQLENEINQEIHQIKHATFSGEDEDTDTTETIYKSTREIHAKLDEILENGLSPSALNKLIQCPLDFFYRYILNFNEAEAVEENIESSTFGTKIHTVLHEIIEDNFRKDDDSYHPITIDALQKENKKEVIRERLESAYLKDDGAKKFSKSDLKYGENKLSFDVSCQFIGAFLNKQIEELKKTSNTVTPFKLEEKLSAEFEVEINGQKKQLKLSGHADRIDYFGDHYRIIDYKSGKCDEEKLKLVKKVNTQEGMRQQIEHEKKAYSRQLMMYSLMFRQMFPNKKPFSSGIISMVNSSDWLQTVQYKNSDLMDDELLDLFLSELVGYISDLYDPEFIFKHNPKSEYCQHCEM